MLNSLPSIFQQYNQNKDQVVDFTPFLEKKSHARTVIRDLSCTVFEKFGCGAFFNDDCIKNLDEIYEPANFNIELLNFKPTRSIFSFLSSVNPADFLRINNECKFYTNSDSAISCIEINYQFLVRKNSEFIKSKVSVVYGSDFEIDKINYQRINEQREVTVNINKNKDMLCSVDDETLFLELFLNDNNSELKELFPSFFQYGVHVFEDAEIESNSTLARMLLI